MHGRATRRSAAGSANRGGGNVERSVARTTTTSSSAERATTTTPMRITYPQQTPEKPGRIDDDRHGYRFGYRNRRRAVAVSVSITDLVSRAGVPVATSTSAVSRREGEPVLDRAVRPRPPRVLPFVEGLPSADSTLSITSRVNSPMISIAVITEGRFRLGVLTAL